MLWLISLSLAALTLANPVQRASSYPPLPSTGRSTITPFYPATSTESFITAKDGKLFLDDTEWTFAIFNNPALLTITDYEINDTFATLTAFARPVTRTYTLGVTSVNVANTSAFVTGWSNATNDWVYNEAMFKRFDSVLDLARQWGCKIVVPIINQDYGDESTNFNGNWADLIRLYYGLDDYNSTKQINFWTDSNLIAATKQLYTKVLTRKNTLNGVTYGQDNSFWAIETGNELNYNMTKGGDGTRPPPGTWTAQIAQHIKSIAPNILVMDGTLSRNNFTEQRYANESLASSYVDIFSNHYYDTSDSPLDYHHIVDDSAYIRSFGKTFVVGEHGFYPETSQWDEFYQLLSSNPVAGAMAWSMRPHSHLGGFITHGEGKGIFSYHMPGWSPPVTADFDPLEQFIDRKTYQVSYQLVNESIPTYPTPPAPTILPINSTSNGTVYFPYQGSPWAEHYELFHAASGAKSWTQLENFVRDDVDAGQANYTVGNMTGAFAMRGVEVDLGTGPWSNVLTV